MSDPDELAKMHCLRSVFAEDTGGDPYLARQIKQSIDFALTGQPDTPAPLTSFTKAVEKLATTHGGLVPSAGFYHLELSDKPYDPLWVRQEILAGLRKLTGLESAILLVTGLRRALCPEGRYWTKRVQKRYEEALNYINQLAAQWSSPTGKLSILCL